MKRVIWLLSLILIAGCAATYAPPTHVARSVTKDFDAPRAELLRAAKRVLIEDGYQITAMDDTAGIISTAPRDTRLTPQLADCGTTMGLDYLKDNRTISKVGVGVSVLDGRLVVTASLSAKYLEGNDVQSISLTCVSKGVIEAEILDQVERVLRSS